LRQIGLGEVAEATKINRRYLEALERNDFSYLPGGLFNRSFVRAYCQTIGIDAETMVNAYLLEEQSQTAKGGSFDPDLLRGNPNARSFTQPRPVEPRRRSARTLWWVLLVAAVAIAAAVLVYLRFFGPGNQAELPASARTLVTTPASPDSSPRGAELGS